MIARCRAVLLVLLFLGYIDCYKAWCTDKKSIQQQTNRAYYNLKSKGLVEFGCNVTADWDTAFNSMKADAVGRERVLPIARAIKFRVMVGPSGAASVSHEFGQAPP